MTEAAIEEKPVRQRNEGSNLPRRRLQEGQGDEITRLTTPDDLLDRANFEYRWANDDGARIANLYARDWNLVTTEGKDAKTPDDGCVRHRVGQKGDNSPLYSYLMRKPKPFFDADKKKKQDRVKADETRRLTQIPTDDETPDQVYKPKT